MPKQKKNHTLKNSGSASVEMSSYEGLQQHIPSLKTPEIEVWEFQYPGRPTRLSINIPEFTCICPKTGLPDFAQLHIQYIPAQVCLELKSLKEYIFFFRNLGIFHEHVVNRMLDDLVKACSPCEMTIEGIFNARGGIQTTATATYTKPQSPKKSR